MSVDVEHSVISTHAIPQSGVLPDWTHRGEVRCGGRIDPLDADGVIDRGNQLHLPDGYVSVA
jgi:hypothetical protein